MRFLPFLLAALLLPAAHAQADGTATITGRVTDAQTGMPVVGAGVVIPALGIGAVSQRDGRYVIDGVPAGTHEVRAGAYLYHLVTLEAAVGDAPATLDVALGPGAGAGCAAVHEHGDDGSHMTPVGDTDEG